MAQANAEWSFFCPSECPGLAESWGEEFDRLYEQYEAEGKARSKVPAQQLWFSVLDSQMETGTPYILYKDSANRKSNQQNLGTIRCSNLCTEIVEYTSPDEVAVCNLASLALPRFVSEGVFDHQKLYDVTCASPEGCTPAATEPSPDLAAPARPQAVSFSLCT